MELRSVDFFVLLHHCHKVIINNEHVVRLTLPKLSTSTELLFCCCTRGFLKANSAFEERNSLYAGDYYTSTVVVAGMKRPRLDSSIDVILLLHSV